MTFAIAHDDGADRSGGTGDAIVWRTCLRDVTFAPEIGGLCASGSRLAGRDAYALLLEILCGLRSPIVGETEVLGQFRSFLSSTSRDHVWLHDLARRLLTDAREIRSRHLVGLGSRTYGSAVRRRLAGVRHVALLGTGALGRELWPFLHVDGRTVDVWGRRERCPLPNVPASAYRRVGGAATSQDAVRPALVIAAPVDAHTISAVASHYAGTELIVDLRGEPDRQPAPALAPLVTLADVFNGMRQAGHHTASKVACARQDIERRSEEFAGRMDLRPFGWDDLCA
jgi:glutamyl-tRNA reductase